MRLFYAIKSAVQRMPLGLRIATLWCAMFSTFLAAALLPGAMYFIDDVPVGLTEFWRRGGGPVFFSVGAVHALLVYGLLGARRWSRPLFVLVILVLTSAAVYLEPAARGEGVALSIVLTGLSFWYMFYRRTVRAYFSSLREHSD